MNKPEMRARSWECDCWSLYLDFYWLPYWSHFEHSWYWWLSEFKLLFHICVKILRLFQFEHGYHRRSLSSSISEDNALANPHKSHQIANLFLVSQLAQCSTVTEADMGYASHLCRGWCRGLRGGHDAHVIMKPFTPRLLDTNLVLEGLVFVISFCLCSLVYDKCIPWLLLGAYSTGWAYVNWLLGTSKYIPLLKIPISSSGAVDFGFEV